MPYSAKILKDSLAPSGARLTTWELEYPRFVHSELMTHREFSRSAASSRAIPIEKMIKQVVDDPAMPKWWGKNQKGMQAREELSPDEALLAKAKWLDARDQAASNVWLLNKLGLHKQLANRLLEPWMFITVIVSATNFENWFHLRCHPDAQPEIKWVADEMQRLYRAATPTELKDCEWHLPLIFEEDIEEVRRVFVNAEIVDEYLVKISTGRCARVSYLTHDGKRDLAEDVALHNRLVTSGHWSPFEHVAQAVDNPNYRSGNFTGWSQYRKLFRDEHVTRKP